MIAASLFSCNLFYAAFIFLSPPVDPAYNGVLGISIQTIKCKFYQRTFSVHICLRNKSSFKIYYGK